MDRTNALCTLPSSLMTDRRGGMNICLFLTVYLDPNLCNENNR